jgi:hypothetical protein
MKQANMRIDARNDLAVELEHQPEHSVRGGMLGAKIDVELADVCGRHLWFRVRVFGK